MDGLLHRQKESTPIYAVQYFMVALFGVLCPLGLDFGTYNF